MVQKQALGRLGENIASSYLMKHGYRILDRNFRVRYGEIDIVCEKDGTLVFVEVKTRTGGEFGSPEESVTPRKLREVVKTATYFSMMHPELPARLRIDVIGIGLGETENVTYFCHTENVTM